MEITFNVCQNTKVHLVLDKFAFQILSFRKEYRYVVW